MESNRRRYYRWMCRVGRFCNRMLSSFIAADVSLCFCWVYVSFLSFFLHNVLYFLIYIFNNPSIHMFLPNYHFLLSWDCWKQIGRKFHQMDCIGSCMALIKDGLGVWHEAGASNSIFSTKKKIKRWRSFCFFPRLKKQQQQHHHDLTSTIQASSSTL